MVKVENSWPFPPHDTWQSPKFNSISSSIEPVQPRCAPVSVSPGTYTNMMMQATAAPNVPSLKIQQTNGVQGSPQMPPSCQNFVPARYTYLKDMPAVFSNRSAGIGNVALNAVPGCQRKFVIFDQSGNETRLIYSSLFPNAAKPTIEVINPNGCSYLRSEEHVSKTDQINLTAPELQEISDENHISGEESEMHEDTEEINALLYSDDDDEDSEDDNADDEVTSTGHSPTLITSCGMRRQVGEITEDVTDSDGQNKRQKLLDGGYKRSSPADAVISTKVAGVHEYDDDAESSCAIVQNQEEVNVSILGNNKQSKKDKIRATLKILESIIPGAKDKDPLLVLDVAIDYLKSLKLKAKTLGMNYS